MRKLDLFTTMRRKSAEVSTGAKELIVPLSGILKNKAELSRLLDRFQEQSVKKTESSQSVVNLKRSGRKKKFTERDKTALICLAKANRRLSLGEITMKFNERKT